MMIVCLIGLAISSYLFYAYVTGGQIVCGIAGHGCDAVRASQWAYVWGVPRPAFGIIFYTTLLALLVISQMTKAYDRLFRTAIFILIPLGAAESLYLEGLQVFVIKAYCIWCLGSAICSFVILGLELLTKTRFSGRLAALSQTKGDLH